MAKVGDKHFSKTTGETFYYRELPSGEKGWSTDPITEDELIGSALKTAKVPKRVHGDTTEDDPEILNQVAETATPELKSVLLNRAKNIGRQTLVGIAADAASGGATKLVSPIKYPIISKLAGMVGGLTGGAATSAALGGDNPLEEAAMDRVLDFGVRKGMQGAGWAGGKALESIGSRSLKPFANLGIKEGLGEWGTRKLAESGPLSEFEKTDLKTLLKFADDYGLPLPAGAAIRDIPLGLVESKTKTKLADAILAAQNRALGVAMPNAKARTQTTAQTSQDIKRGFLDRKATFKQQERVAHERLEGMNNQDVQTVSIPQPPLMVNPAQVGMPGLSLPAQAAPGQMISVPQPPIIATYVAPINISGISQDAHTLRTSLQETLDAGDINDPTRHHVGQLIGLLNGIADAPPTEDGSMFMNYADTATVRNSLRALIKDFPSADSRKTRLSATANKIMNGLSQATHETAQTWSPERRLAYSTANQLTMRNAHLFNNKDVAVPLAGNQVAGNRPFRGLTGKDLDVDPEQTILDALKSDNGVEQLRRSIGAHHDDQISSVFVKLGFDHALDNKTGLYDGEKLNNYFFKNTKNNAIMESDLLLPEQRRVIKDFTKYAQRLSSLTSETPTTGLDWKTTRMASGLLSFGVGGLGFLAGGGLPMAAKTGLGLAVAIPITSNFIEGVLMNPQGGKLVQKLIYAPTTQQQLAAKQSLTEFAVKHGAKVFIRAMNDDGTVNESKELN